MTSTPPAKTRTHGFGRSFGTVCSMKWRVRQNRRETAAQATPSRMTSRAVRTFSSGAVRAKWVGAMPKASEQP